MFNEPEEVEVEEVVDNDTPNEENSETESDGEAQTETTNERAPETPEAKRARLKRQLDKLDKKLGIQSEDVPQKGETEDERYDRLELKTEGIKDKKAQDAVIEYARYKKIGVLEALATPAMKAELKEIQAKESTPSPSVRTGQSKTDDVAYWANQLERYGKSAPTPELRSKVRAHLAGKH